MTQSKQEEAERKAKLRADKLRENLARRKQQNRERASVLIDDNFESARMSEEFSDKNSLG